MPSIVSTERHGVRRSSVTTLLLQCGANINTGAGAHILQRVCHLVEEGLLVEVRGQDLGNDGCQEQGNREQEKAQQQLRRST